MPVLVVYLRERWIIGLDARPRISTFLAFWVARERTCFPAKPPPLFDRPIHCSTFFRDSLAIDSSEHSTYLLRRVVLGYQLLSCIAGMEVLQDVGYLLLPECSLSASEGGTGSGGSGGGGGSASGAGSSKDDV